MPRYFFEAKSLSGEKVKGKIDSANPQEAQTQLRDKNLILLNLSLDEGTSLSFSFSFSLSKRVTPKELQIFTRQFSVLLGAGIPVVQSLEAMMGEGRSPGLNQALQAIVEDLREGKKLSEALEKQSHIFYFLYVNLIKVGEESGNLKEVLVSLSDYIEKSEKLKKKVMGAMMYPLVVGFISFLVVVGIMIFVIPRYQAIFASSKAELPQITQIVIQLSHWVKSQWYIMLLLPFVTPLLFYFVYSRPMGKSILDQFFISIPVFGGLIRKANLARFSRNFSTLIESGVQIIRSVEISVSTITNDVLMQVFHPLKEGILRGRSLVDSLKNSKQIPNMVLQMMDIGEKTGNLGQMMTKIADFYEDEVEITVDVMTQLIEPLMMLFLGLVVACIMLAINLPIFRLVDVVT